MSAQTTSQAMIKGGSPTIFITDMPRAVAFYTEILGLRLQYRAGDHFAMIDAGDGLSLGLHPPSKSAAAPGTPGSIQVGLNVGKPLAQLVETLRSRGVRFQQHGQDPIVNDGALSIVLMEPAVGSNTNVSSNSAVAVSSIRSAMLTSTSRKRARSWPRKWA